MVGGNECRASRASSIGPCPPQPETSRQLKSIQRLLRIKKAKLGAEKMEKECWADRLRLELELEIAIRSKAARGASGDIPYLGR